MANTMELEINGTVYAFKAGFAFIREAEPIRKQKQNGTEQNVGLNYILGALYDGDVDMLLMALDLMNKGQTPRVTKADLESYIEDCDDIEQMFKDVMDFLQDANCTRTKARKFYKMVQEMEERQKQESLKTSPGENSTDNA